MRVAVLMNSAAGSIGAENQDDRRRSVEEAFATAGVEALVHPCEPARLTETARQLAGTGVDAVVAAGGDGTISAVAAGLVGGQVPLGVLPLGTLNHFARDIGMPKELAECAHAIAQGEVSRLDVGEINGRVFVNNSSIGIYPEVVMTREAVRKQTGRSKWTAMLIAVARVLRRFPVLRVRVTTPDAVIACDTPVVFVGNNEYRISMFQLGERPHLDRGHLSLYTMRCKGRLHMLWLMVRAVLQRLDAVRDFEATTLTEATVSLGHRHRRRVLKVALDGEVVPMTTPLQYRSLPGALPVLLPPAVEARQKVAV